MLKENIKYMDIPSGLEMEEARELILDIHEYLSVGIFNKYFDAFDKRAKGKLINRKCFGTFEEKNNLVMVFRGTGDIADSVSIYLFDTYSEADNFCNFMNDLKQDEDKFIYARHGKQMVEYEITKPVLIRFEQILEQNNSIHTEYCNTRIIREALKKFGSETLLKAIKGLDKHSRKLILQRLPNKTVDLINERIAYSDKHDIDLFTLNEIRQAQQKILDAINRNTRKFERGGFSW